jgi:predicted RNA-binding Zn-ribbon protein involved in translation (DUF1610 family)
MTVATGADSTRVVRRATEIPCPQCGVRMNEVCRASESRATYVWYQCPNGACTRTLLVEYA